MKLIIAVLLASLLAGCTVLNSAFVAAPGQHANPTNALAVHNAYRARHHAPPLVWDATLARYAARHASHCVFKHSHSPYGENLAAGYPTIGAAAAAWYAEQAQYHYFNPGFSSRTGHFTQMVWRSSKRLGCGYADCKGKNGTPGRYWVCEYSPAGNVINRGYFTANVLP
jgi:uncharacterized protein YkwD